MASPILSKLQLLHSIMQSIKDKVNKLADFEPDESDYSDDE